jgi:hypothetical protein
MKTNDLSVKVSVNSLMLEAVSNIPYNFIFTTKFNDFSILITIISCDYLNLSLANEYVGDATIPRLSISVNSLMLEAVYMSVITLELVTTAKK